MRSERALPEVLGGFDLTDQSRFAGFPYELFARLRREAPVLLHPPGRTADGEDFWVLSRYEDIAAAAANPALSSQTGGDRKGGGTHLDDMPFEDAAGVVLAMMDDPRHELIKRTLAPAMTGAAVAELEERLRPYIEGLVDDAIGRERCDFVTDVTENLALHSMALLLGIPERDRELLARWGRETLGMVDRRTGAVDEGSWANMVALSRYCYEAVAARKGCPGSGLGDLMIGGDIPSDQGQEPLSDIERAENLTLLQITGLEQPRNIIAGGVAAFAQHPDQWQALRSDRSLLPGAVEEVLRWTPANPYNRRTATRDLEISGKLIRRGDKVTLWWASANRDEAVFEDPMRFDIRRDPNPHLSFGYGPHFCAGAEIGRMQTRLVLETLLDRVEVIRSAGPVIWGPNNKHCVLLDVPVHLVP